MSADQDCEGDDWEPVGCEEGEAGAHHVQPEGVAPGQGHQASPEGSPAWWQEAAASLQLVLENDLYNYQHCHCEFFQSPCKA